MVRPGTPWRVTGAGQTRRRFMAAALAAAPAAMTPRVWGSSGWREWLGGQVQDTPTRRSLGFPTEGWHGDSSVAATARLDRRLDRQLRDRVRRPPSGAPQADWRRFAAPLSVFRDLRRHFIFEYYPWYQSDPWVHWEQNRRTPPIDVAAFAVPLLGAYDSRSARVIEQHARWMADAGVGAVNLSWWGPGSVEDRAVPLIMDVMRAHDIHVTFHLEPYADDRSTRLTSDLLYLVREYGEKRRWDNFLLLEDSTGRARPIFKLFRAILPRTTTDCRGRVFPVPDYTEDAVWRRQMDTVRSALLSDFNPILLADSLDVARTGAGGFDGMAIYDPFVRPSAWPAQAAGFSTAQLLFSFNANPGYDTYPERGPFGECFVPAPFEPPIDASGWDPAARELAFQASRDRILDSLRTTLTLQIDSRLVNAQRGFFATYLNSFNEWHEGTSFEPAANLADLSPEQRAIGYHNPDNGRWRLQLLQEVLSQLTTPTAGARGPDPAEETRALGPAAQP